MTPPCGGQVAIAPGPDISLPGACFDDLPRFARKRDSTPLPATNCAPSNAISQRASICHDLRLIQDYLDHRDPKHTVESGSVLRRSA